MEKNNDVINNALVSLVSKVNASNLNNSDKNAMNALIDKVSRCYNKKLELVLKGDETDNYNNKQLFLLNSFITDIIVEINSVLVNDNDIYYFVSVIDKRLRDNGINKLLGSKKK